jgi:transposase
MKEIMKNISYNELIMCLNSSEISLRSINRVQFIMYLYEGMNFETARKLSGIASCTGKNWIKKLNEEGLEGLLANNVKGNFKLSRDEKIQLKKYIKKTNIKSMMDIKKLIKDEFNVEYSYCHLKIILKELNLDYRIIDDIQA